MQHFHYFLTRELPCKYTVFPQLKTNQGCCIKWTKLNVMIFFKYNKLFKYICEYKYFKPIFIIGKDYKKI